MTSNTPNWISQHPDLMWIIVLALVALIGALCGLVFWFIRREFTRFDRKLTEICEAIKGKADNKQNEKVHEDLWHNIHAHGHEIDCDGKNCKPYTTGFLLKEG